MKDTNVSIAIIKEQMKQNSCEHEEIKDDIKELKDAFNVWCENADKKFASKLTEKIVYGLVGILLSALVYYALSHLGIKV